VGCYSRRALPSTLRGEKTLRLVPALLALASLGAFCPGETRRPPGSAPEAEVELAPLSAELSEPGGYFDTDNLISNETPYLQVADQLAASVPTGGVYVGVGPDQNFSYIARVRPRYAFILDIRRQNMLQHLLFSALFAQADDPYQYLCRLFSRPCPSATPEGALPGVERTLRALEPHKPSEAAFTANLDAIYRHVESTLGFSLRSRDRLDIRNVYRAFFDEQAEIRFRTFGRTSGTYHPTYRMLLLARSPSGRFGSFLDSPEDYSFVRDLSRAQRIVPVVGDFGGPHALRAIGGWVRAHGLTVSAFYTSNVEFYLMRNHAFAAFVANLRELPSQPESVLIRSCFDYGRSHPAEIPGNRSVLLLQRLPRFLELYDAGAYTTDWDVCTADYLR
jgi:hypothetical protein